MYSRMVLNRQSQKFKTEGSQNQQEHKKVNAQLTKLFCDADKLLEIVKLSMRLEPSSLFGGSSSSAELFLCKNSYSVGSMSAGILKSQPE